MPIKVCISSSCAKAFQLNAYAFKPDMSLQPGRIMCPHCGMEMKGNSDYIFLTHALSKKQEERFLEKYFGAAAVQDASFDTRAFDT